MSAIQISAVHCTRVHRHQFLRESRYTRIVNLQQYNTNTVSIYTYITSTNTSIILLMVFVTILSIYFGWFHHWTHSRGSWIIHFVQIIRMLFIGQRCFKCVNFLPILLSIEESLLSTAYHTAPFQIKEVDRMDSYINGLWMIWSAYSLSRYNISSTMAQTKHWPTQTPHNDTSIIIQALRDNYGQLCQKPIS